MIIEMLSKTPNPNFEGVFDVTPDEVNEKASQVVLIDVRGPDEFSGELGHVSNSKLIVLDQLAEHINELPKDQTIIFICRSGNRSAQASLLALQNGLENTFNMQGGMILWNELKLETKT